MTDQEIKQLYFAGPADAGYYYCRDCAENLATLNSVGLEW